VLSKSIHQPSRICFLFLLKTRAIDREGRSTLRYARASLSALHRASGLFLARYLHPAFRAFFLPVLLKSRLFPVDCPSVSSFAYLRAHPPPKASISQRRRSRALPRTRVVHSASACYIIFTPPSTQSLALLAPLPSRQSRQHKIDCRLDPCKFFARRMI
jgi:hypothetical protein